MTKRFICRFVAVYSLILSTLSLLLDLAVFLEKLVTNNWLIGSFALLMLPLFIIGIFLLSADQIKKDDSVIYREMLAALIFYLLSEVLIIVTFFSLFLVALIFQVVIVPPITFLIIFFMHNHRPVKNVMENNVDIPEKSLIEREIDEKIASLRHLYENGTISETEYREQVKRILERLN